MPDGNEVFEVRARLGSASYLKSDRRHRPRLVLFGGQTRIAWSDRLPTKRQLASLAFLAAAVLVTGCVSSKLTRLPSIAVPSVTVETVAISPTGGIMADAIGVELFAYGFAVVDTQSTSRLLGDASLVDFLVLQDNAIHAVLDIQWYPGYDGSPDAVVAKLLDTLTGNMVAGVSWQNGRGGARGSPADAMARKGLNEAAAEIAGALAAQLR